jgi:hypothetical protein
LIWRQVEVPTSITLKVLHDIIQIVMGWFDAVPAPTMARMANTDLDLIVSRRR